VSQSPAFFVAMARTAWFCVCAVLVSSAHGASFEAVFVGAGSTADTLQLKRDDGTIQPIRLYGVASPLAEQRFARKSVDWVNKRLKGTSLMVETVSEDNSGLPVAWVRPVEGPSVNEQLVREGLAWIDEPNAPNARKLKKLVAQALIHGKGLWKDSAPLAPWDYRTSHGMKPVTYTVELAPEEPPETVEVKETPTLAAKGTAKPRSSIPGLEAIPKQFRGLVSKHQPRIARDDTGTPLGLTASDISSIPGAGLIGFQNGDIVSAINGIPITNEGQLLGLANQLRGAKELKLQIIRNGGPISLSIPLP
jgi:endonuclease YncB( thermonuclease family)